MSSITSSFNEIKIDGSNNQITIGSNEKFEPAVSWLIRKVDLKIKNVGKRYLPNNLKNSNIINKEFDELFSFLSLSKIPKQEFSYYINEIFTSQMAYSLNDFAEISDELIITLKQNVQNPSISNLKNITAKIIAILELEEKKFDQKDSHNRQRHNDMILRMIDFEGFLNYKKFKILEKKVLLVVGEALIGKTHLFCDTSLNGLDKGNPYILFFGNEFNSAETIITNMINILGIINI